jgi:hypothetical protein
VQIISMMSQRMIPAMRLSFSMPIGEWFMCIRSP